MRLADAIAGYWLDKQQQFSERTIENYLRIFEYLVNYLNNMEFEHVTSDDIRRFLAHLATTRNLSKRSQHDAWVPLSSLWTWAEKELGTPHIIRGHVKAPAYSDPAIDPLTANDIRQLLDQVDQPRTWEMPKGGYGQAERPTAIRDRAIILTLLDSGIRASEFCDLEMSDYDERRGRLHIRQGKGAKSRYVFLGDRARKALWRYLATRKSARRTDPLFATKDGNTFTRYNLHQLLQRMGDRAGVEGVHPHRFRHTFAITFLRNGGNVFELQRILGHESLHTVQIYLKLAESDIEAAGRTRSPADNWKL